MCHIVPNLSRGSFVSARCENMCQSDLVSFFLFKRTAVKAHRIESRNVRTQLRAPVRGLGRYLSVFYEPGTVLAF